MCMKQSYGKQDVFYIHDSIPCLADAVVSDIPYIFYNTRQQTIVTNKKLAIDCLFCITTKVN